MVVLYTIKIEFMTLTESIKEGVWLRSILFDLGIQQQTMNILCDNQNTIQLAKYVIFHERSKYINVRSH